MIFPGEHEAMLEILRYADEYGYGNIIHRLKAGWALKLLQSSRKVTVESACLGALFSKEETANFMKGDYAHITGWLQSYSEAKPEESGK